MREHIIELESFLIKEFKPLFEGKLFSGYPNVILDKFSEKYPANVVRFDLESNTPGHRGIFFQGLIFSTIRIITQT